MSPFTTDLQMAELEIQEQQAELQADIEARIEFNQLSYMNVWLQTKNIFSMHPVMAKNKAFNFRIPDFILS